MMRTAANVVMLALLAGPSWGRPRKAQEPRQERASRAENWHSLNMEATAIMGEMKYKSGDLDGARETFRDSLNRSTKIMSPGDQVMGLDLYRSAELAARNGDFGTAREQLEILISRYPDTDFARKGEELLNMLPRKKAGLLEEEEETPVMSAEQPEFIISRIREALQAGQHEQALEACRDFAARYPGHRTEGEVRVLASALYLRSGQPARAARILKAVVARTSDAGLRAKAIHLLGAADAELGDFADILIAVPENTGADIWLERAQLWRAAALEQNGRRAQAERLYRAVSEGPASPGRAFALARLAALQEKRGGSEEARESLLKAAAEAPRWGLSDLESAARLSVAHVLYGARRFAAAAGAYADFVKRRPDDPLARQALFQQGLALKRCGRPREAAAAFNRLVEESPNSVYAADAHLQLGQLYDALGAASAAVAHYEEMGRSGGKSEEKESLLLRAQVHYNAKRYKAAIPFYRLFLERNPADSRAREVEELLLTSFWLGDRDNPELGSLAARYPRHDIAKHIRWGLAVKAYRQEDYSGAQQGFVLFAADFPTDTRVAETFFYLGECRMKLGDHQGAALSYKTLLTRFPKNARGTAASLRLGAALYSAGDFNGSAEAYAKVASGKHPQAAAALYSRAVSLLQAGDRPEALTAFEEHLRRFPKDPRTAKAWLEVARLQEELGKLSEAAFAYAHASPGDSEFAAALFSAARLREKLKQTDLAVRNYEKLRRAQPPAAPLRVRGLLRLGLLYELKGRPMKAMPLYAEVLKLAPREGEDFAAARRRMQQLTAQGLLTQR